MPLTFLGKWRIYYSGNGQNLSYNVFYDDDLKKYITAILTWYGGGPPPPDKVTHIAFFLRDDGQLCFLLNNGQYFGLMLEHMVVGVNTLDEALGFAFPGYNPQSLPTSFTATIKCTADGMFLMDLYGNLVTNDKDSASSFTMSQITPTLPSIQRSGNGEGMDFAWLDLTGVALNRVSLINADFSNCNLNHAKLTYCVLVNAMLTNCQLTGTDFSGSLLDGASLTGRRPDERHR